MVGPHFGEDHGGGGAVYHVKGTGLHDFTSPLHDALLSPPNFLPTKSCLKIPTDHRWLILPVHSLLPKLRLYPIYLLLCYDQ